MGILSLVRRKAVGEAVPARSSWFGPIGDWFSGAWQRNVEPDKRECLLAFSAVYACVTVIASDIAKLRPRLMEADDDGIWVEADRNSPFKPVIRKPNRYQTHIQFFEQWLVSRLLHGNTYVLKERDQRGIVTSMYVLDPNRVVPLVTPGGDVYYQLASDNLAGLESQITVPASEIIHDRAITLWHPLVGVSPIYACGASATQGNRIQANSARFFENMSRPSGMLTAPGKIDDVVAARMKQSFEQNFSSGNLGRLFVAGNGLKYVPITISAQDAQLIEQLKWTVEDVARAFRVPLYKINAGPMPSYGNGESLNRSYYNETLQNIIESIEVLLDEGLSLPQGMGVEFDIEALMRMDTDARYKANAEGVKGGWLAPNEARRKENLKPLEGGDTVFLQQQNYSLEALARRDAGPDPFGQSSAAAIEPPAPAEPDETDKAIAALWRLSPENFARKMMESEHA